MKFSTSSKRARPTSWLKGTAALSLMCIATIAQPCTTEASTLTIPLTQSSFANVVAWSPQATLSPQFGASYFSRLSGQVVVDYSNADPLNQTITFSSATHIAFADQSIARPFLPFATNAVLGAVETSPGADQVYLALRNLAVSLESPTIHLGFGGIGAFNGTIAFPQGTADVQGASGASSTPLGSYSPDSGKPNKLNFFPGPNLSLVDLDMYFTLPVPNTDITLQYELRILAAVPEPTSLSLAAAVSAIAMCYSRRLGFRKT